MAIPPKLYKYQSYSGYALESLIKRKIWISSPEDFNDPFDCQNRIEDVATEIQLNKAAQAADARFKVDTGIERKLGPFKFNHTQQEWESPDEFADRIRNDIHMWGKKMVSALTRVGIYSLATKPDDLLMWAHYADQHKGFVIGFDSTQLRETNRMQVVEVTYVDKYEKLELGKIKVTHDEDMPAHLRTIASQKGRRWQEEHEWRLVFPFSRIAIEMPMPPVEVIFGHRMQESQRETLHQLISQTYTGVEFSTAEPSNSEFRLEILRFQSD